MGTAGQLCAIEVACLPTSLRRIEPATGTGLKPWRVFFKMNSAETARPS